MHWDPHSLVSQLVDWCLTAFSAQTGYRSKKYITQGRVTRRIHNKTTKQHTKPRNRKHSSAWPLRRWTPRHISRVFL